MCLCTWTCWHLPCLFSTLVFFFFLRGAGDRFSLILKSISSIDLQANEFQRFICLCPPTARVPAHATVPDFYVGPKDTKPGPLHAEQAAYMCHLFSPHPCHLEDTDTIQKFLHPENRSNTYEESHVVFYKGVTEVLFFLVPSSGLGGRVRTRGTQERKASG